MTQHLLRGQHEAWSAQTCQTVRERICALAPPPRGTAPGNPRCRSCGIRGKGILGRANAEIAKRADITSGTLYLYFTGKEEIFKSLVTESIGPQILTLAQMARGFEGPTPDLIRLVMRAIIVFLLGSTRAVLPKLIIAETGNFPELARFYKTEATDRMLAIFEGMVRRGIERGEFREINPKHGGRLLFQPAMFTAIWRASFGALDSEPYDYQGLIETHLDVVLRGFAAEKPP